MSVSVKILSISRDQLEARLAQIKAMKGAGAGTDGEAGFAPAPKAGEQASFLRGDGTWAEVPVPTKEVVGLENVTNDAQVKRSEMGAALGVATLDEAGKVPAAQLPSYVDDVIEAASLSGFPAEGEGGKIYVALDTNLTYRWSGTAYVEISQSLALGETASTAYAGDKGKQNAESIAALTERMTALEDSTPTDSTFQALTARVAALETLLQGIPDGTVLLATTETD